MNFATSHKVVHLSTDVMRDRLDGNWASSVIHMDTYRSVIFVVDQSSGVGQGEVSIRRADDIVPTTTAGVSTWRYRSSTSPDAWSAWTTVSSSSGFLTGITPDKVYECWINAEEVRGTSGFEYCFLDIKEITNAPVEMDVLAIMFSPKYASDIDPVSSLT